MIGSPTYFSSSETTLPASRIAFNQVNRPFWHSKVPMADHRPNWRDHIATMLMLAKVGVCGRKLTALVEC
jgi:hypothetical protein